MNEKQLKSNLDKLQKAITTLIECNKLDKELTKRGRKIKSSEDVRALYKESEVNWRKTDKAFHDAEKVLDKIDVFAEEVRCDVGDALLNVEDWVIAKNREDKLTKTAPKKGKKK